MKSPQVTKIRLYVLALIFCVVAGCQPLIAGYNESAYNNATSLKVDSLALMDKASESYAQHQPQIAELEKDLQKAYEYANGIPKNEIVSKQWHLLIDPEGNLMGQFLKRWKDNEQLSEAYISEYRKIISSTFDSIICLEINKKAFGNTCVQS